MNVSVPATLAACTLRRVSAAPPAISTSRKALAFAIMCLGCFIAYLDIQIVSASVQEIGGGLSASQDELSGSSRLT
jgi:MFS transporter, DHA2 family, multidrug resistance protein